MLLSRLFALSIFLLVPSMGTQAQVVEDPQDTLVIRMNKFARTYKEFAYKHDHGEFDIRLAKKLSEQWRDVERSGEWPDVSKR